jgi:hypothetical protein
MTLSLMEFARVIVIASMNENEATLGYNLEIEKVEMEPTTERYEKRLVDCRINYSLVSGNV